MVIVVMVHRLMAPALVLRHMDGHMHLLDHRHVHLLVDGHMLDDLHVLDDGHVHFLGVMMMHGVNLVRHMHQHVLAALDRMKQRHMRVNENERLGQRTVSNYESFG